MQLFLMVMQIIQDQGINIICVRMIQIRLEYKGYVVVFSGDYKTQPDFISTPYEPVKCHEFITESTFGLPIYKWKKEEELQAELQNWVLQNQQNNSLELH